MLTTLKGTMFTGMFFNILFFIYLKPKFDHTRILFNLNGSEGFFCCIHYLQNEDRATIKNHF